MRHVDASLRSALIGDRQDGAKLGTACLPPPDIPPTGLGFSSIPRFKKCVQTTCIAYASLRATEIENTQDGAKLGVAWFRPPEIRPTGRGLRLLR
eukprot:14761667-Alexandrium_andersonii.AAC.1